jgi:hypothetical protein
MSERFDAKWRSDEVQDAMADEWAELREHTEREGKLRLQIEMAAKGCISGKGSEWPFLLVALRHWGECADGSMLALELRAIARRVCTREGWRDYSQPSGDSSRE